MQYAATAANELIAQQYMKMLDPFFEPADDGSLIPRTVQLALDENHYFDLPLVALSTPRGLMLEKMKVNLTIRTEGMQAPPAIGRKRVWPLSRQPFTFQR
jgi:hypothetical protein